MTETVYLDRLDDSGAKTVSTMGTQPGPVGGDGWSVVAELPVDYLRDNRHYAFWVTGKISNVRVTGATPVSGLMQLCLGDASGVKSPLQLVQIGAADNIPAGQGIPFAFLLIFSASPIVVDPVWGATWSNAEPLQLLGRTWWRNDVPAYAVEFDVQDLTWIWADLDAIPGSDQLVTVSTSSVPLGSSPWTTIAGSINNAGSSDETWLHLFSIAYKPGVGAVPAFQVGSSTGLGLSGFVAQQGSGSRLGMGHRGTNVAGVIHHHGTFWVQTNGGVTNLPGGRGYDRSVGSTATTVQRFAVLSIRLDDLPGVHWSTTPLATGLTDTYAGLFEGTRRWPLELESTFQSVTPWVFQTGIVERATNARLAFGAWTDTNDGELPIFSLAGEQTDGPVEAIPTYGSGRQGIGPTSNSIQYRARWLEEVWSGYFHNVRDVFFLTVFPVKNPDNVPNGPPDVGAPTAIVPGTEALSAESLPELPLAPDIANGETLNWRREDLTGITGHKRTWGVFARPRRSFSLTWSPITAAQRDELLDFLRDNLAWQITPLRELAPIAVVPVAPAKWAQESGQTFRVDLEVAELVYTG